MTEPTGNDILRRVNEDFTTAAADVVFDLAEFQSPLLLDTVRLYEPHVTIESAELYARALIQRAISAAMPDDQRAGALELLEKFLPRVYLHEEAEPAVSNHAGIAGLIQDAIVTDGDNMTPVVHVYIKRVIALIDTYSGLDPLDIEPGPEPRAAGAEVVTLRPGRGRGGPGETE